MKYNIQIFLLVIGMFAVYFTVKIDAINYDLSYILIAALSLFIGIIYERNMKNSGKKESEQFKKEEGLSYDVPEGFIAQEDLKRQVKKTTKNKK